MTIIFVKISSLKKCVHLFIFLLTYSCCFPEPSSESSTSPSPTPTCGKHTMSCLDKDGHHQCLPEDKKCDGVSDCLHEEDEIGCEVICQYDLQQESGVFSSPNYPGLYPENRDCSWAIKIAEREIIQLRFVSFSLEDKFSSDYVKVYDGTSVASVS